MMQRQLDEIEAAKISLHQSITLNPYNWAAWQELSACLPDTASASFFFLPEKNASVLTGTD